MQTVCRLYSFSKVKTARFQRLEIARDQSQLLRSCLSEHLLLILFPLLNVSQFDVIKLSVPNEENVLRKRTFAWLGEIEFGNRRLVRIKRDMTEASTDPSDTRDKDENVIDYQQVEEVASVVREEAQELLSLGREDVDLEKTENPEYTSQSQRLKDAARAAVVAAVALRDEKVSRDAAKDSAETLAKEALQDSRLPQFSASTEEEADSTQAKQEDVTKSNVFDDNPNLDDALGNEYSKPQATIKVEETSEDYNTNCQVEAEETLYVNETTGENPCSIAAICTTENTPSINSFVSSSPQGSETVSEKEQKIDGSSSTRDSSSLAVNSKNSFNRPADSRVFIGNLASERTTVAELVSIFSKYGTLIEEPVIRRSFGFVQYDNADSAYAAIENEQGRVIGGMPIDLSLADNRDSRRNSKNISGVGPDRSRKSVSADRFNPYEHSGRSNTNSRRHSKGS